MVNDRYTALTVDSVLSPLKEKASGEGPVADGRQLRIALQQDDYVLHHQRAHKLP